MTMQQEKGPSPFRRHLAWHWASGSAKRVPGRRSGCTVITHFPGGEKGGLQDEFGKKAWEYLKKNTDESYFLFEDFQGQWSLRYARADLMQARLRQLSQHPPRGGPHPLDSRSAVLRLDSMRLVRLLTVLFFCGCTPARGGGSVPDFQSPQGCGSKVVGGQEGGSSRHPTCMVVAA